LPPHVLTKPACDDYEHEDCDTCHWLVTAGWVAFMREHLLHRPFAVLDPAGTNDGVLPPAGSPVVADFNDLEPSLHHGFRAAVGYYRCNWALEVGGFYLADQNDDYHFINPGRLSAFFVNPPIGFTDLWDNADLMSLALSTRLASLEINSRWFTGVCGVELEFLVGVRYVNLRERFQIFTDDDGLQLFPTPAGTATHSTEADNHLVGAHVGWSVHAPVIPGVGVAWDFRSGWYGNDADVEVQLVRGDGLVGLAGADDHSRSSQTIETGLYLDFIRGCWRVRMGYNLLWLNHVALAPDQVDFNLANTTVRGDFDGEVLYHGPTVLVDVIF
jgi:hypothetical protein